MTASPHLLSSYELRDLNLRNRVVLAPLTRSRSGVSRVPNDLMAEYYVQRASAGLVITEATTISANANGWEQSPGIYTDDMQQGWRKIVDAVHRQGGKIFCQLWHTGRASHSSFLNGELPVGPSAIKIEGDGVQTASGKQPHEVPRALETSELAGIVENYRKAATRAKAAGFDGIEVHSANGYLLDSFLQSKTNHRTDQYGGSLENRFRLLEEVLQAVTTVFPANRVGVRLSPNGVFNDMGSADFRELFTFVAIQLDSFRLAYLHVMDGLAFGFHEQGEAMTLSDFRAEFAGPLMGNCGYTQATAEAAIESESANLIAFGRPFISNPDLVERFAGDLELAPDADMSTWYSPTGAEGYTDFPKASKLS